MATYITTNDGTLLYDDYTAKDYLTSLGIDVDDLRVLLYEDVEENAYREGYMAAHAEDERVIDGYFCACRDLAEAVDNLCDLFLDQYKAKAIVHVLNAVKTCVQENRID